MANKTYKLQDISRNRKLKLKLDDYIVFHWCRAYRGVYGGATYSPRLKPESYELYTENTEKWLWHLRLWILRRKEKDESENWIV